MNPVSALEELHSWLLPLATILWTCLFNQFFIQLMVHLSNPSYNKDVVGIPCQKPLILLFSCLASCFITQSNQVGQAPFPLGKSLLPFPRLLHVPGNSCCEDLFQPLKWDWLFCTTYHLSYVAVACISFIHKVLQKEKCLCLSTTSANRSQQLSTKFLLGHSDVVYFTCIAQFDRYCISSARTRKWNLRLQIM